MSIQKVSVIIPCYKAAATLRRTVASVLDGAPADVEILLVDDGSPDNTGAVCEELAELHPQVTALHRPNGGPQHRVGRRNRRLGAVS